MPDPSAPTKLGDFILAANPYLEEALRVGEKVLPRVRARLVQAGVCAAAWATQQSATASVSRSKVR